MITPMKISTPTPKSMPWPTPQRPAQAAPVRRESVPAGGGEPGEAGGEGGGIHPSGFGRCECGESSPVASGTAIYMIPFAGDDSD